MIVKVCAALHTAYIPNVHAVAQNLTRAAQPQLDEGYKQLVLYAKKCVQPGLDYYERQRETNLKKAISIFKAARLFSPQKFST